MVSVIRSETKGLDSTVRREGFTREGMFVPCVEQMSSGRGDESNASRQPTQVFVLEQIH